jgi:hypothetical protein
LESSQDGGLFARLNTLNSIEGFLDPTILSKEGFDGKTDRMRDGFEDVITEMGVIVLTPKIDGKKSKESTANKNKVNNKLD